MTFHRTPKTSDKSRRDTLYGNKIELEDTHLICVEPTSKTLFAINLGTQEVEKVDLNTKVSVSNQTKTNPIDNKIKREEYKLDQLLDRDKMNEKWFFKNTTAESYRRQMVPFYLL